jgi:electron transport complex protein RnfB
MAIGDAPINQCPPGGNEGRPSRSPAHRCCPEPRSWQKAHAVAVIDEAWCIGCTLCLDARPTDAILAATS